MSRSVRIVAIALALSAAGAASPAQSPEHLARMTSAKLDADLGNHAKASEAFTAIADDRSAPVRLRAEALVRLGLIRSAAGDTRGSREAFDAVLARHSDDRHAVRFATGALAASVPGRIWPGYRAQIEELLRTAPIVAVVDTGMVGQSARRVRLEWDGFEVRAVWRPGEVRGNGPSPRSHPGELAAYELDKLIGLDMIPPTVARTIDGQDGAMQFWVTGVRVHKQMDELPRTPEWVRQLSRMKLFDALIGNTGRVLSNMMVDQDQTLMLVDHTEAFSTHRRLKDPPDRFDRRLVEKLRALGSPESRTRLEAILGDEEIVSLLARKDALLQHMRRLIAERGEGAVLY